METYLLIGILFAVGFCGACLYEILQAINILIERTRGFAPKPSEMTQRHPLAY